MKKLSLNSIRNFIKKNPIFYVVAIAVVLGVVATGSGYYLVVTQSANSPSITTNNGVAPKQEVADTLESQVKTETPTTTKTDDSTQHSQTTQPSNAGQSPSPNPRANTQPQAPVSQPAANVTPGALFTSGQTFCSSSITWAAIVESNFSYYNGTDTTITYQVELVRAGATSVIYTGTMNTGSNGSFDVRPPSGTNAWAPNIIQGDVLYVRITSPFNVASKPYVTKPSEGACTVY